MGQVGRMRRPFGPDHGQGSWSSWPSGVSAVAGRGRLRTHDRSCAPPSACRGADTPRYSLHSYHVANFDLVAHMWDFCTRASASIEMSVNRLWQAFLRRFDIEHTFRILEQTLGWNVPKPRDPAAADRWTWLFLAAYTQLRLARELTIDIRRPWEKPAAPQRLISARVRRGFRHLRRKAACPASAPKPSRPGPGRPAGHRNQRPVPRYDVHIKTPSNQKPSTPAGPRPRRTG